MHDAETALEAVLARLGTRSEPLSLAERRIEARALLLAVRVATLRGIHDVHGLLSHITLAPDAAPALHVEHALLEGRRAFLDADFDAGRAFAERALAGAQAAQDGVLQARAHLLLGSTAPERRLASDAEAAALFSAAGAEKDAARAWLGQGFDALNAMQPARAAAAFEAALALAQDTGDAVLEMRARGYLGNVARYRADYGAACAHYDAALSVPGTSGGLWSPVFRMDRGLTRLLMGELDDAIDDLHAACTAPHARALLLTLSAPALRIARRLRGEDVALRGVHAEAASLPDGMAYALELYAHAAWMLDDGVLRAPPAQPLQEQHAVIASRVCALVRAHLGASGAWAVQRDGRGFAGPDGVQHGVTRPLLARLLVALAAQRAAHPGVPLSTDALFEKGWPDERAVKHAAHNRVRVALAALRKAGLRDGLVRTAGGYMLDPAQPFAWRHASARARAEREHP